MDIFKKEGTIFDIYAPNTWNGTFKLLIGVVIVFIIFIIITCYRNLSLNEFLYGMWVCDNDFCQEAELGGFYIMIGEPEMGLLSDTSSMYVVMYNTSGDVIENKLFNIKIGHSYSPTKIAKRSLKIIDDDYEGPLPKEMNITISVMDGHMVLYGVGETADTIYGTLYKDHDSTHKAKLLEEETA